MKYGIVLYEKNGDEGLNLRDINKLCELIKEGNKSFEVYPIEILAREHESSAMGFITYEAADDLDFNYIESGLDAYIAEILDDMELESDDCNYTYKGINIWLSR